LVFILAQANGGGGGAGAGGGGGFLSFPVMLGVLMLLFWLLIIRPDQKKRKDLQDSLGNLKVNDRVVTIGGIYGVVTNVQKDADKVTLRVDESNNTKISV